LKIFITVICAMWKWQIKPELLLLLYSNLNITYPNLDLNYLFYFQACSPPTGRFCVLDPSANPPVFREQKVMIYAKLGEQVVPNWNVQRRNITDMNGPQLNCTRLSWYTLIITNLIVANSVVPNWNVQRLIYHLYELF
jgi:hypothetical protein